MPNTRLEVLVSDPIACLPLLQNFNSLFIRYPFFHLCIAATIAISFVTPYFGCNDFIWKDELRHCPCGQGLCIACKDHKGVFYKCPMDDERKCGYQEFVRTTVRKTRLSSTFKRELSGISVPKKAGASSSSSDLVETVAQFGVIFLLFALGLEFSSANLRIVRAVAIMGGLLQIFLFMCLSGAIAVVRISSIRVLCSYYMSFEVFSDAPLLYGGEASEGVFVGAFLSMSSTAVVLKILMEKNSISTLYGQVTVGTLILQDCAVGLLFALLPILGGTSGMFEGMLSMTKTLVTLITFLAVLSLFSRTCIPWFFNLMISLSSQTNELYQLASVAFCLIVASSPAGVMISTTDHAHHTLEQVEPIRNFFAALFLASIGMLIHVKFLWNHIDILLAAVILVVVQQLAKWSGQVSWVMGLKQGFLVKGQVVSTASWHKSLVTTPFLFKPIPAIVHLGVLLRWFSPELPTK
ncbi:K(+) efflux antiporter 4, partial [Tanacetum coccineum]